MSASDTAAVKPGWPVCTVHAPSFRHAYRLKLIGVPIVISAVFRVVWGLTSTAMSLIFFSMSTLALCWSVRVSINRPAAVTTNPA